MKKKYEQMQEPILTEEEEAELKKILMEQSLKDIPEDDGEPIELTVHYRRGINRIMRENGQIKRIPYPEVDNIFERVRSRIMAGSIKLRRFIRTKIFRRS
ncbi:MAG: hypothetical protein IJY27_00190 [Clostridia bacterium]|nr:hypothetical protein [Clostridia bacterium]